MDDFKTAINTAVGAGPCVIDASRLTFVDVAGMRQLAEAAEARATPVRLLGVRPVVERSWALGRFAEIAPTVELVG
jgi:anti-anti-sigma regulatory factor